MAVIGWSGRWLAVGLALLFVGSVSAQEGGSEAASLKAPATVWMNGSIDVVWRGPDLSGDTIRFIDTATNEYTPQYVYVGNTKDGAATLRAPAEPGAYELVYVSKREILFRLPITVTAVTATLEAPAEAEINGRIEVRVDGPGNSGDYLQIIGSDGTPIRGLYAYVGNFPDGNVTLKVPNQAGDYRIGYFTAGTLIGSTPIAVGAVEASLRVPETVPAGALFDVAWQGPDNSGDRMAIMSTDGTRVSGYAYTGNEPETASLRAPEQAGEYQVVYLTGDRVIGRADFSVADVSASIEAADTVAEGHRLTVAWEGPGNTSDIIRFTDPANGETRAYGYVGNGEAQSLRITAPALAGDYQLEYVTGGGRTLARRPITVTPAPVTPGQLRVLASEKVNLTDADAVEVILDASGSMLQRLEDERRIDIAKRTLTNLVQTAIPAGTGFALRVFGHREVDSCRTDLEIPLSPLQPGPVSTTVAGVSAMNLARTPIAASLAMIPQDLKPVTGERIVVLLTDGEETCEGDPAEVIGRLRSQGADIRVNIVGFAIDDVGLKETFTRWARLGGGAYFDARGEAELAAALGQSVNPEFVVLDLEGETAARGLAGQDPVLLPPGDYQVSARGERYPVSVVSDRLVTLTLD